MALILQFLHDCSIPNILAYSPLRVSKIRNINRMKPQDISSWKEAMVSNRSGEEVRGMEARKPSISAL